MINFHHYLVADWSLNSFGKVIQTKNGAKLEIFIGNNRYQLPLEKTPYLTHNQGNYSFRFNSESGDCLFVVKVSASEIWNDGQYELVHIVRIEHNGNQANEGSLVKLSWEPHFVILNAARVTTEANSVKQFSLNTSHNLHTITQIPNHGKVTITSKQGTIDISSAEASWYELGVNFGISVKVVKSKILKPGEWIELSTVIRATRATRESNTD